MEPNAIGLLFEFKYFKSTIKKPEGKPVYVVRISERVLRQ
jgi:hypothetical protein